MKTTRYIAKCNACKCHTSTLATDEDMRAAKMFAAWPATQPKPAAGKIQFINGSVCLDCRVCGKAKYASPVRGTYSAKHECNEKCMSSHGMKCECSCGGKNHGASHAA